MFISTKDTPPRSHPEAILRGLLYGEAAVEHALPLDMFEAGLDEGVKTWRQAGCATAWIDSGVEAARAAYRAPLAGDAKLEHSPNPKYWQDRAEEVRTIADSVLDDEVKRILGEIADSYDALAVMAVKQTQK
jgi:hypothetical protein